MTIGSRQAIYETKGRAREFSELAANLYTGCGHGCIYCWGPNVTHQDKKAFYDEPKPRKDILEILERDATRYQCKGETRPILLCFTTDPYQPIETEHKITQRAIDILHAHNLRVTILTKAGQLANEGILQLRPGDAFATTLTLTSTIETSYWEPHTGTPEERVDNLRLAKDRGIETWVSCEPVIYTDDTLELIRATDSFVDHYKVGTLNYHPRAKLINWHKFALEVVDLLDSLAASYYIKKDLAKYLPPDIAKRLRQKGAIQ